MIEKFPGALRVVARKLVDRAEQGEIPAIKEIFDRVDGRVPQAQLISNPEGGPVNVIAQLLREIDGKSKGLPSHALSEAGEVQPLQSLEQAAHRLPEVLTVKPM